ncbi:hypothetical protein CACET_c27020 [Clostridium aceticum]|uniref:Uncharacterized protein n=1 Tax=Clostridium aceticum TaxID=84022 RepID=A0A0D8IBH3_9CLOT|nr:hypothetical protein [Clostridium aceticum]AKL96147.1 hypothetical protein CACET_c27020 [Clostridium aceticum]KJF26571.1 hypothetical protein TZ02_11885 [Clostridium aceticum]
MKLIKKYIVEDKILFNVYDSLFKDALIDFDETEMLEIIDLHTKTIINNIADDIMLSKNNNTIVVSISKNIDNGIDVNILAAMTRDNIICVNKI